MVMIWPHVAAAFCPAEKHRDADRPDGWCQLDHVGANRRPIGTESSSTMPMASPASLAAPPIARHCTPDDYSDDCRESTIRVCAEVDTWAIVDRSGPLTADSYPLPTVCNAATIGSSHKRRWSDRRHQLAYRGAASGLLMACEARYSGRSESDMASLGPALSATIPG